LKGGARRMVAWLQHMRPHARACCLTPPILHSHVYAQRMHVYSHADQEQGRQSAGII
jgi:hypothetical protein